MKHVKYLYAIVLNYNNATDTIECIRSFKNISHIPIKLVIVDNNSDQECINIIKEAISEFPYISFIEAGKNLGYAGGNNIGIKYSIENGAEYIAIVNNDVVVNETTFDDCIHILDSDDGVAFVGPAILEYNSDIIQYTGGIINYNKLTSPHLNYGKKYVRNNKNINCDYVGGACMVFKPRVIKEFGYLPECYFLYWEETEWCAKANKAGKRCICTYGGFVNHKGSASIKQIKGIESYYLERNRIVFSIRNDELRIRKAIAIIMLMIKTVLKGLIKDKSYFSYLGYYMEGIKGIDRYNNIPGGKYVD